MPNPPATVVVLGATGRAGQSLVKESLDRGWNVIGVARDRTRLASANGSFRRLAGDISTEAAALALAEAIGPGSVRAVFVAVNAPAAEGPLTKLGVAGFEAFLKANLVPHFAAARAFIPRMPSGSTYLALGGGTADVVIDGLGHHSAVQAAQRMLIRAFAKEAHGTGVLVKELLITAMITPGSTPATAGSLPADAIARTACDLVAAAETSPDPIVVLGARQNRAS